MSGVFQVDRFHVSATEPTENSMMETEYNRKFTIRVQEAVMERRPSYKKTMMAERERFVWMWLGGLSYRAIAQWTGASATTVQRWVSRWQREGDLRSKKIKPRGRGLIRSQMSTLGLLDYRIHSQARTGYSLLHDYAKCFALQTYPKANTYRFSENYT